MSTDETTKVTEMGALAPTNGIRSAPPTSPQSGWLAESGGLGPTGAQQSLTGFLQSIRDKEAQKFRSEVHAHGGPEAWLRAKAPNIRLPLLGSSPENLFADTAAAWIGASERIEQCQHCPPFGGTCANHGSAVTDGKQVQISEEFTVQELPCAKWRLWQERNMLISAGLPELLLEWPIERVIGTARDVEQWPVRERLFHWCEAASKRHFKRWLLVTGGTHVVRTRLVASVARELVRDVPKRIHYTWAPQLAFKLKDHFSSKNKDSEDAPANPLDKCEAAWCLFMDFVDPRASTGKSAWAEWYIERVDSLFFHRLSAGLPTVIGTPLPLNKLADFFPMSGPFLDPTVVDIGSKFFGPIDDGE